MRDLARLDAALCSDVRLVTHQAKRRPNLLHVPMRPGALHLEKAGPHCGIVHDRRMCSFLVQESLVCLPARRCKQHSTAGLYAKRRGQPIRSDLRVLRHESEHEEDVHDIGGQVVGAELADDVLREITDLTA